MKRIFLPRIFIIQGVSHQLNSHHRAHEGRAMSMQLLIVRFMTWHLSECSVGMLLPAAYRRLQTCDETETNM